MKKQELQNLSENKMLHHELVSYLNNSTITEDTLTDFIANLPDEVSEADNTELIDRQHLGRLAVIAERVIVKLGKLKDSIRSDKNPKDKIKAIDRMMHFAGKLYILNNIDAVNDDYDERAYQLNNMVFMNGAEWKACREIMRRNNSSNGFIQRG